MQRNSPAAPISKTRLWAGRIVTAVAVLFLLFDSVIKLMKAAPAMSATTQLGFPESAVLRIGIVELVCVIVHLIPRTSVLGAILLTGYLGGPSQATSASATHYLVTSCSPSMSLC
jgi:hypothetical protein